MILGLSTSAFTLIHVAISLIAIVSGLVVTFGMIAGNRMDKLTVLFLITTVATSLTGFAFPNEHLTPGIIVGIISMVVLIIATVARYAMKLAGAWRWIYVVDAVIALYLNVFVLIVQSFQKVSALKALAPHGNEPPFAIAQGVVLVVFIVLGVLSVKKFHTDSN